MRRAALLLLAGAAAMTGCSRSGTATLTVFAASSLTDAFGSIAKAFESEHPGIDVRLSVAGSTALARQIRDGAPANVFAAADEESVALVSTRRAGEPAIFARNRLAIAVREGNPRRIATPADLARPGVVVVLCARETPCGRRTDEMLDRARVPLRPAGRETSVRSVLLKVATGEADAGVVYETDLRGTRSRVEAVALPASVNVVASYPIVALRGDHPGRARSFVEFVLGPAGRAILRRHGFLEP